MEFDVEIRKAIKKDIKGILKVQKDFLLPTQPTEYIKNNGFLVYPIQEDELKEIIENTPDMLLVAIEKEKVIGYILSYDLEKWKMLKPEWAMRVDLDKKKEGELGKKVLYLRHVARKQSYRGIGKILERSVLATAKNLGFRYVIGEILESPYSNEISKRVHIMRGFSRIGTVKYKDKTIWGLYKKKINHNL